MDIQKNKPFIKEYSLPENTWSGISVIDMEEKKTEHDIFNPHRDSHYLLVISNSGRFNLMVDFENITIEGSAFILIAPGCVHQILEIIDPKGWAISFDGSAIHKETSTLHHELFNKPFLLSNDDFLSHQLFTISKLLLDLQASDRISSKQAKHCLLNALINLIGNQNSIEHTSNNRITRKKAIENEFLSLLFKYFRNEKMPSFYAKQLSLSTAHLNDTIKELTGITVTQHIQRQSILEAKRLLYVTNLTVKEICYAVGYQEPIYFGKLFKKLEQISPLAFREKFHD